MEMKKCKECGKLFMPKSTRSQYCDDLHYRPCPVCGKAVEAKYLSDPARCCSKECQQALKKQNTSAKVDKIINDKESTDVEIELSSDDTVVNVLSSVSDHNIHSNLSDEGQFILGDAEVRTYVGRSCCRFVQGHTYAIKIWKDPQYGNYMVDGYYDLSEDKQCEAHSVHASMISFNQFFLPVSKKIVVRR